MTRLARLVAAGLLALQAGCAGYSFGGHEGGVTELVFLPGEPTRLAVRWAVPPTGRRREDRIEWPGPPGPIEIREVPSGRRLARLTAPPEADKMAVSPDGRLLACGRQAFFTGDRTLVAGRPLVIWSLAQPRLLHQVHEEQWDRYDGPFWLWDAGRGVTIGPVQLEHGAYVLASHPRRPWIAATGHTRGTQLLDRRNGSLLRWLGDYHTPLAVTPESRAAWQLQVAQLEQVAEAAKEVKEEAQAALDRAIKAAEAARDPEAAAANRRVAEAKLRHRQAEESYGRASLELVRTRVSGSFSDAGWHRSDTSWGIAFEPHGPRVAAWGHYTGIYLWDGDSGSLDVGLVVHAMRSIRQVAFSPDGQWMVSVGREPSVIFWHRPSGQGRDWRLEHQEELGDWAHKIDLAMSSDGRHLAIGLGHTQYGGRGGGCLALWRRSRTPSDHWERLWLRQIPAYRVAISPDSRWLAAGLADGQVRLWRLDP